MIEAKKTIRKKDAEYLVDEASSRGVTFGNVFVFIKEVIKRIAQ